jgi:hypothetical protein
MSRQKQQYDRNRQRPRTTSASSRPSVRKIEQERSEKRKRPIAVPSPHGNTILMTRRRFLYGALGIGAASIAAGGAIAVGSAAKSKSGTVSYLHVTDTQVISLADLTEVTQDEAVSQAGSYTVPFGTLVWAGNAAVAACLIPTASSHPLSTVSLLRLSDGSQIPVLDKAQGNDENFEIYDVRCSDHGLIWTEANILEGYWRIYVAPLSSSLTLGSVRLVDEGGSNVETPTIGIVGDRAFWVVMPSATADDAKTGDARLKGAYVSSGDAEDLYVSKGSMATPLYAGNSGVAISPRNASSNSYYDLVYVDAQNGNVLDSITLPSGMKPIEIGYGSTGFSFCFESIYSYGDGIANLGTYTPLQQPSTGRYDTAQWFRFGKTPLSAPCWCGSYFVVKSTQTVCFVNLSNRTYCTLDTESGCSDWGDYLASTGTVDQVVSIMTIDQTNTSGESDRSCHVRIWTPTSA